MLASWCRLRDCKIVLAKTRQIKENTDQRDQGRYVALWPDWHAADWLDANQESVERDDARAAAVAVGLYYSSIPLSLAASTEAAVSIGLSVSGMTDAARGVGEKPWQLQGHC